MVKSTIKMSKLAYMACFVCVLCVGLSPAQNADILVESGVRLVRNGRDPVPKKGIILKPTMTEDLRIGEAGSSDDSSFARLTFICVDDDENIIALDGKDMCFRIFDKDGRFVRRFGRRGQGPDEIQTPVGMMLSGGKDIVILDAGNNRLAFYSKDGVCIKRVGLKKVQPFAPVMDSRGHFYGSALEFGDKVNLKLVKFDQEFNLVSTVGSLEMPKENEIPPPELMEQFVFQIGEKDSLIWGTNFRYELNFTDIDGQLYKKASRAAVPEEVTRDLLIREMKRRNPDRPIPDSLRVPPFYPKHFPFFSSLVCDDEGRIFVRTLEDFGSGHARYDVFDAEGIYIARFDRPENEEIIAVKKAKAYVRIRENEEGIPVIKRYRIEWH